MHLFLVPEAKYFLPGAFGVCSTCFGPGFCYVQDATDEHDPGSSDTDEVGISDADLEKLMKGLEHGSSRSTSRRGAARRGDLDEVIIVTACL